MADAVPRFSAAVLALAVEGAHPLHELAGLPLALRTVLTLQKEGATRIFLVVAPDDAATPARVCGDARVRVPISIVHASTETAGLASAIAQAGEARLLVAAHSVVSEPKVYRILAQTPLGDALAVVARSGERAEGREDAPRPVGPLIAARSLSDALSRSDAASIASALAALAAEQVAYADVGSAWCSRADSTDGRARAFHELFEACRKPVDGVVARHINRHISIFISKRLVGTPLSPNMMSVLTFLLGVGGAVCAAIGGYGWTLLGAFLFQWNSILDGVDGELARVRFQHSRTGQWLDTVSDDLSNLVFYAGLAVGAARLPFGRELMWSAWVAIGAGALTAVIYYSELIKIGSGDLYAIEWGFDKQAPPGIGGKLLIFFRFVVKKDFAILFFLFLALLGVLPYALPIIATGQVCVLTAAALRAARRRTGSPAPAP